MDTFSVSFFGHRHLDNVFAIESKLEELVHDLLIEKEYVQFLIGRDGDFDVLAASVIKRCKRTICDNNSALIWVLPYMTAELKANEEAYLDYYDEIEICEQAAGSHYKSAFQKRNRSMVDRSDLVVFCVERKSGGAYQTMRYAEQRGIDYINIFDEDVRNARWS